MIILTFEKNAHYTLGVKLPTGILDVALAADDLDDRSVPITIDMLMHGGFNALNNLIEFVERCNHHRSNTWFLPEYDIKIGPCVASTGKIVCVGLNYKRHAAEAGLPVPSTPILFSKYSNALATTHESIPLPTVAAQYDYEAELVIVMGKAGKYILKDEALSYVLGYANGNDISARDLQGRTSQWMLGKTLDKFMPVGPYLVTYHDIPEPQNLSVRCWHNGKLRQDSHTKDMIFGVADIVHYVSQYFTLSPGDIITTGTPEGVIFGHNDPQWMKPGDEVIVEIEKLGRLVNTMSHDPQQREV